MTTLGDSIGNVVRLVKRPFSTPQGDLVTQERKIKREATKLRLVEAEELSAEQQGIVKKVVELMKKEGDLTADSSYGFFKQLSDVRLIVRKQLLLINRAHRQIILDIDKEKEIIGPAKNELKQKYNNLFNKIHGDMSQTVKNIFQQLTSVDSINASAMKLLDEGSLVQVLVKEYFDLKRNIRKTIREQQGIAHQSRDIDAPAQKRFMAEIQKMETQLQTEGKLMKKAVSDSIVYFNKERRSLEARRDHMALLLREQGFPPQQGQEVMSFLDSILHGVNEQMHAEEDATRTALSDLEQLKPAA